MATVRKSLNQFYSPSSNVLSLMKEFKQMTNDCIRIGLENGNVSTMKRISKLSYKNLEHYDVPSYYKLNASSKAAGILASRKKSIRRGFPTRTPFLQKPILVSCYGFKIVKGGLRIPIGKRKFEQIPLTKHIQENLSDSTLKIKSFTLTKTSLSLCISKEVPVIEVVGAVGVDRNLRNLSVGNQEKLACYDVSKVVEIGETTKGIVRSFKRNDARIRKKIASKYGRRKTERVKQILHAVSKDIVKQTKENKQAIVFEDIRDIRRMYQKGNWQGKDYRRVMNNWPFAEIKRQIEYKAQWSGVPIIHLTKSETRGTSTRCYRCGERLQGDRARPRQLWCKKCKRWFDRDLVAVMNISYRGWLRFDHSSSKGGAGEAMVQEPSKEVAILRVDASKLSRQRWASIVLPKI